MRVGLLLRVRNDEKKEKKKKMRVMMNSDERGVFVR